MTEMMNEQEDLYALLYVSLSERMGDGLKLTFFYFMTFLLLLASSGNTHTHKC